MPVVLRSVDVVLQNSTPELLTLEGFSLLRGVWGPPGPPRRGDVVEKQSSAKWQNQSVTEGVGVQGYLRLGSTKGYVEISWNLPFFDASRLEHAVETPPKLQARVHFNRETLDFVVMRVTLSPKEGPRAG